MSKHHTEDYKLSAIKYYKKYGSVRKTCKIFDCSKGKLLKKYLKIIKEAKHGRGAGVNPCIDCRIFMLQEAKKFADKKNIKIIATGEVIGQRPMSQQKKQMAIIEKATKLGKRIKRP